MTGRTLTGELDREFITIYFLQEEKEKRRLAVRRLSLVLGVIFFLFAIIGLRVWQQMQVVKLGYEINQYRQQYHQLLDENRILLSRRNALASMERIETIAREAFGLEMPQSQQLIFLVDPAAKPEGIGGWFSKDGFWGRWFNMLTTNSPGFKPGMKWNSNNDLLQIISKSSLSCPANAGYRVRAGKLKKT
ncbi:cell division protein FtsL [bacterium]|nr:cell division protein FtsL [bacterium]